MNLFDQLARQAMQSSAALGTVRTAVEKELLHHDILREMNRANLLAGLTFIGGTCLRSCYDSPRLSEDLDFTGGKDFKPAGLNALGTILKETLMKKYGLPVSVSEPEQEKGNVSTWKLLLQTRPASKHLPAQRIHIDICALNSHQRRPALLRNFYGVDMGTDGLIVQAQTREEILADKYIALAFRPNRIQYRDLWDILWLERQGIFLDAALLRQKLADRSYAWEKFLSTLQKRTDELKGLPFHQATFIKEMERFLPSTSARDLMKQADFWTILLLNLREQTDKLLMLSPS